MRIASLRQSFYGGGRALRGRIGVHNLPAHDDTAAERDFIARHGNLSQRCIAPLLLNMAEVDLDPRTAGNAVHRAGEGGIYSNQSNSLLTGTSELK
jgi:hypothetical protein